MPVCAKACDYSSMQNGCECCPYPGFELDPLYNDAYKSFDGSANIPDECKTLNLFPLNPWDTMMKLPQNAYASAQTIVGLPPIGTVGFL